MAETPDAFAFSMYKQAALDLQTAKRIRDEAAAREEEEEDDEGDSNDASSPDSVVALTKALVKVQGPYASAAETALGVVKDWLDGCANAGAPTGSTATQVEKLAERCAQLLAAGLHMTCHVGGIIHTILNTQPLSPDDMPPGTTDVAQSAIDNERLLQGVAISLLGTARMITRTTGAVLQWRHHNDQQQQQQQHRAAVLDAKTCFKNQRFNCLVALHEKATKTIGIVEEGYASVDSNFLIHRHLQTIAITHELSMMGARLVRDCLGETLKIHSSVHDVKDVTLNVQRALRAHYPPPPDKTITSFEPCNAHSTSFRNFLDWDDSGDPTPDGLGRDFFRKLFELRSFVRTATGDDEQQQEGACNGRGEGYAKLVTEREHQGIVNDIMHRAMNAPLTYLANHYYTLLNRFPRNVMAWYGLLPITFDVLLVLSSMGTPLREVAEEMAKSNTQKRRRMSSMPPQRSRSSSRLMRPATGSSDEPPSSQATTNNGISSKKSQQQPQHPFYANRPVVPLPQPDKSDPGFPNALLQSTTKLHAYVGIATDKMCAEIQRIVSQAAAKYNDASQQPSADAQHEQHAPESGSNSARAREQQKKGKDEKPPTAALMTCLSSIAQPLLAISRCFRDETRPPAVAALMDRIISFFIRAFIGTWATIGATAKDKEVIKIVKNDYMLFERFFAHHPVLEMDEELRLAVSAVPQWVVLNNV